MTIPRLRGWGEAFNDFTKEFAPNFATALNPNWELQRALPSLLTQNPQLAKQLADLEAQAPGTLQKMGLGNNASNMLAGLGPSFEWQTQNEQRQAINKLNPDQRGERDAKLTGVRTATEVKKDDLTIKTGEQQIGLNDQNLQLGAMNLDEQQRNQIQRRAWEAHIPSIQQIMDKHKGNLFAAERAGDLSGEILNAAMNLPQFGEIHKRQREDYWDQRRIDLGYANLQVAKDRLLLDRDQYEKPINKKNIFLEMNARTAAHIAEETGFGNAEGILAVMQNPQLAQQPEFAQAAQAITDYRASVGQKPMRQAMTEWRQMAAPHFATLNRQKASDEERGAAVQYINDAAATVFGAYGLDAPQIGYGKAGDNVSTDMFGGFFKNEVVHFTHIPENMLKTAGTPHNFDPATGKPKTENPSPGANPAAFGGNSVDKKAMGADSTTQQAPDTSWMQSWVSPARSNPEEAKRRLNMITDPAKKQQLSDYLKSQGINIQ